MKQVGAVSQRYELDEIRFTDCSFALSEAGDDADSDVRLAIADRTVTREDPHLRVGLLFEFSAYPPTNEYRRRVDIRARMTLRYRLEPDQSDVSDDDAHTFGIVNGIYNAWPYLREYVQSSLVRLSLPQFELPLLRVGAAARLAGLVDTQPPPGPEPDGEEPAGTR